MLRRLAPAGLAALGLVALVLAMPGFGAASAQAKVKLSGSSFASGCTVPRVTGHSLSYARYKIVQAGCRVGKITFRLDAKVTKNHVISQRPVARKRLPRGTRVNMVVSKGVNAAYCASHLAACYNLTLTVTYDTKGYDHTGQPAEHYGLTVQNTGLATVKMPTVYIAPWQITSIYGGGCQVPSSVTVITSASPQPNSVVSQGGTYTAGQWTLGDLKPKASKKISFSAVWPSCFQSRSTRYVTTYVNAWAISPSRPGFTWSGNARVTFQSQ